MRELWKILELCRSKHHMARVAMFPGGAINVAIYDSDKQMKQYIYDSETFEEIEERVKRDFGIPSSIARMPLPPGFPRP